MAVIVWTDVTDHFPTGVTTVVNAQTTILAYVNAALVVAEFGGEADDKLKLARIYLAAHFGTIAAGGVTGVAGAVVEEEAGDLRRKYASFSTTGSSDPSLSSTAGGRAYLTLLATSPARSPVLL